MTGQGTQECPLKQVGDEVVAGGQEEVARFLIFTPSPRAIFLLNGLLKRSRPFLRWNMGKLFNTKTKANLT